MSYPNHLVPTALISWIPSAFQTATQITATLAPSSLQQVLMLGAARAQRSARDYPQGERQPCPACTKCCPNVRIHDPDALSSWRTRYCPSGFVHHTCLSPLLPRPLLCSVSRHNLCHFWEDTSRSRTLFVILPFIRASAGKKTQRLRLPQPESRREDDGEHAE